MEFIIAGLILLLGLREYLSYRERRDMVDRLMSKNFQEYKDNTKPEENQLEPVDDGLKELDDAKQEIIYGKEE